MALQPGVRLGPYEVQVALGAGGMGEVYKARDTRLDRTVAIKILPPHLAEDPQFRERFDREARTISQLDHPHICALYDVGEQDGTAYLVMQYLEGETLAARLANGALPIAEALTIAIQIADALDKAHRHGIVHRDLKPGNVMLTKAGATLLDFGLAKLGARSPVAPAVAALPTMSANLTGQGMILGTLQYMAPEQLEGKEADPRTDVFAFGAVLYEMATGKKAFEGTSQASVIAAILSSEPPPISTVQPTMPAALDHLIKMCLSKNPDGRRQTARDVLSDLRWIAEGGSQTAALVAVVGRSKLKAWLPWIAATILASTTLALAGLQLVEPVSTYVGVVRFAVPPPEKGAFGADVGSVVTVSPDGRRLALVAVTEGKKLLWVRSLDSPTAQPLTDTEDADSPFWSPDSRFLGFFARGRLKKIDVAGGPSLTVCAVPGSFSLGGTWNRDGVIVFAQDAGDDYRLYRVSAAGGEPTPLTIRNRSRQAAWQLWPSFLPDGRHFLYHALDGVSVGSLDSNEAKHVLSVDSKAEYVPPGYLLFVRERTLLAQPFDLKRLEITGEAVPIADQVRGSLGNAPPAFSVSETGVLAYAADFVQISRLLLIRLFQQTTICCD